jgi:hypothetical protein
LENDLYYAKTPPEPESIAVLIRKVEDLLLLSHRDDKNYFSQPVEAGISIFQLMHANTSSC